MRMRMRNDVNVTAQPMPVEQVRKVFLFSLSDTGGSEEKTPSMPNVSETNDVLIY